MLKTKMVAITVACLLMAGIAFGQNLAPLAFEVASVKATGPLDPVKLAQQMAGGMAPHIGLTVTGTRVDIGLLSMSDLIGAAYKVKKYQISGPDWMNADRFEILAKLPDGGNKDQVPDMLQSLLAERFKLAIHHDSKEQPVYELSVGKNGIKLKESDPEPVPAESAPGATPAPTTPTIKNDGNGVTVSAGAAGTTRVTRTPEGKMRISASKMTMQQLCDTLTQLLDRPVLDKTDLKGNYQVTLDLAMEDLMAAAKAAGVNMPALPSSAVAGTPAAAPDPGGTSMFAAMQELGLRLDSRKAPVDMIVIDHVERTPIDPN